MVRSKLFPQHKLQHYQLSLTLRWPLTPREGRLRGISQLSRSKMLGVVAVKHVRFLLTTVIFWAKIVQQAAVCITEHGFFLINGKMRFNTAGLLQGSLALMELHLLKFTLKWSTGSSCNRRCPFLNRSQMFKSFRNLDCGLDREMGRLMV